MLPHIYRLPRLEFKSVKKSGHITSTPFFGLLVKPQTPPSPFPRFGFIVSTKIHRLSTRRNRIKRLLRQVVKLNLPNFPPSLDVVFLAKKNLLEKSLSQIDLDLKKVIIALQKQYGQNRA